MVEFAFVAILLLTLLFGIIEFGWLLASNLDIRHGAREGGRLIAVDADTDANMLTAVCDSMDLASGTINVTFDRTGNTVGDRGTATVSLTYNSLVGLFDGIVVGNYTTAADVRLEQPPNWTNGYTDVCP